VIAFFTWSLTWSAIGAATEALKVENDDAKSDAAMMVVSAARATMGL
jgi:hypothetical protein